MDTTPLNDIVAPADHVDLNSQRIINLANAVSGNDALNQNTADSRYYANTTPLNEITAPTDHLSLNSQKV